MSVEQTTQLIQLILNSILVMVVCALVLGGLNTRQAGLDQRLSLLKRQLTKEMDGIGGQRDRLLSLKKALRHLQHRQQTSHYSLLAMHYALLFAILSTLMLALRTIIEANGLIALALVLFVMAVTSLTVGAGFILVDLHLSQRSLLEEARTVFSLGMPEELPRRMRRRNSGAGGGAIVVSKLASRSHTRAG